MKITKIVIKLQDSQSVLKAFAAVTFDDVLTIERIRVVEKEGGGLFTYLPDYKGDSGGRFPFIFIWDLSLRRAVHDGVRDAYLDALSSFKPVEIKLSKKKKVRLPYQACECGRDKEVWQPRCDTCKREIKEDMWHARLREGP